MRESTLGGTMGDNLYGGTAPSHKTKCRHSNNPYGHSPDCVCGWYARSRPSQVVPYSEPGTAPELPASKHADWFPVPEDPA